jgi:hypothetical protein
VRLRLLGVRGDGLPTDFTTGIGGGQQNFRNIQCEGDTRATGQGGDGLS